MDKTLLACTYHDLLVEIDNSTLEVFTANGADGEVIGYAEVSQLDSEFMWIDRLFVDPRYRLLGIGTGLMRKIKAFARDCNRGLCLGVARNNEVAINFYEEVGFSRVYQYPGNDSYLYSWPGGDA